MESDRNGIGLVVDVRCLDAGGDEAGAWGTMCAKEGGGIVPGARCQEGRIACIGMQYGTAGVNAQDVGIVV